MKRLMILVFALMLVMPMVAQEKKTEKTEQPKFEVKKYEIMKSQKTALAFLLEKQQKELSELLNDILTDLRIAYPDMPENVTLNQKTWTFEAKVPVEEIKK